MIIIHYSIHRGEGFKLTSSNCGDLVYDDPCASHSSRSIRRSQRKGTIRKMAQTCREGLWWHNHNLMIRNINSNNDNNNYSNNSDIQINIYVYIYIYEYIWICVYIYICNIHTYNLKYIYIYVQSFPCFQARLDAHTAALRPCPMPPHPVWTGGHGMENPTEMDD